MAAPIANVFPLQKAGFLDTNLISGSSSANKHSFDLTQILNNFYSVLLSGYNTRYATNNRIEVFPFHNIMSNI